MEHKKYNLSVELEATNAEKTQKDIQQVAETVRKTGDEAQKAGRVVSNSLGSAVRDTGDKAKTASRTVSNSLGSAFRKAGAEVKEFATKSVTNLKKVGSAAMSIGRGIKTGLLLPLSLASKAFGLLKGVAIGAIGAIASAYGAVRGFMAALGPASEMQQYQIQMEVLLKDADKARKRMDELTKYAKNTNYSPQQVIQAANLMQSFGIYTFKRLQILGDVANAFGRDISEIVTSVNYLASGRSGEALESLSRFGVTRQKLSEAGMQFAKNGSLVTESKQAVDILFRYMEQQFGGMTARQSKTIKGALQQLGGAWWDSFANGMQTALKPVASFITGHLIPLAESVGKFLASIDWEKKLAGPLRRIGGIVEIIRSAIDPATSEQGMKRLKTLASEIGGLFTSAIKDIAGLIGHLAENGGFGAIGGLIFNSITAGAKFFVALLKTAWGGMSDRFRSDIISAIPGYGGAEKRKRDEAAVSALISANPALFAREMANANRFNRQWHKITDDNGQLISYDQMNSWQRDVFGKVAKYANEDAGTMGKNERARYDAAYSRYMGWGSGANPNAEDYFKGLLDKPLKNLQDLRKAASGYVPVNLQGSMGRIGGIIESGARDADIRKNQEAASVPADWMDRFSSLSAEEREQYIRRMQASARRRMPLLRQNSVRTPPQLRQSSATPSASSLIPDIRKTRGASFSAPVAAVLEEEKERRKRRTSRNNGLGSGHAITGGRHDAVLRRRGKTRGDVLEEAVQQGGRSRGSSGKSVESAIEKGFQRGFEKLEAKIGKRIFVVV